MISSLFPKHILEYRQSRAVELRTFEKYIKKFN